MQTITGKTQLLGVIGYPIEHSLSPLMHNAAIAHLGLDCVYLPFAIKPENLRKALNGFEVMSIRGFNVTIPHKKTIIPLLSEVSERAKLIGAVNTVWQTPSGWAGTNTDVDGFLAPLKDLNRNWAAISPIILGNGGTARAVAVGLLELGCLEVQVIGRNPDKLVEFQQGWQSSGLESRIKTDTWDNLPQLLPQAELLVNSTPIGMTPHIERSPLDSWLIEQLPATAIAYDLIYTPNPTAFLQKAKERGLIAVDGLEMLVQQGAAALEIWSDRPAPVEIMRQSLHRYLKL